MSHGSSAATHSQSHHRLVEHGSRYGSLMQELQRSALFPPPVSLDTGVGLAPVEDDLNAFHPEFGSQWSHYDSSPRQSAQGHMSGSHSVGRIPSMPRMNESKKLQMNGVLAKFAAARKTSSIAVDPAMDPESGLDATPVYDIPTVDDDAGAAATATHAAASTAAAAFGRRPRRPSVAKNKWSAAVSAVSAAKQLSDNMTVKKILGSNDPALATPPELQQIMTPFMIHPDDVRRRLWDLLLTLGVVFTVFFTPFEIGFGFQTDWNGDTDQQVLFVMDWTVFACFVMDIILNFRTAVVDDGELISKPWPVAQRYLSGWFALDLLATIPYDTIAESAVPNVTQSRGGQFWTNIPRLMRLVRLLRFARILRALKLQIMLRKVLSSSGLLVSSVARLSHVAFWMLLLAHTLACIWYFLADLYDLGPDTWAYQWELEAEDATYLHKYIISLYWAFVTVATVGYGDIIPKNDSERVFVIFCTFLGNSMFAFMIGKMTTLATQADAPQMVFTEKMDAVNDFLRSRRLPKEIRQRVRAYYTAFWSKGLYFDEDRILDELSSDIRRDIITYCNADVVRSVPFFQNAEELFIHQLLLVLKPEACLANDNIIRQGDIGTKMYILRKGVAAVVKDDIVSHYLTEGAFFGEVTLLFPAVRRTVSVRAITNCELVSLAKSDLDCVAVHYPEFREMMRVIAHTHLQRDMVPPGAAVSTTAVTAQPIGGSGAGGSDTFAAAAAAAAAAEAEAEAQEQPPSALHTPGAARRPSATVSFTASNNVAFTGSTSDTKEGGLEAFEDAVRKAVRRASVSTHTNASTQPMLIAQSMQALSVADSDADAGGAQEKFAALATLVTRLEARIVQQDQNIQRILTLIAPTKSAT